MHCLHVCPPHWVGSTWSLMILKNIRTLESVAEGHTGNQAKALAPQGSQRLPPKSRHTLNNAVVYRGKIPVCLQTLSCGQASFKKRVG